MRVRRVLSGLALVGALIGIAAPSAMAAGPKIIPTRDDLRRDINDLKMQPPVVGVPSVDPQNPQIPNLPYVALPPGVTPALGVISPLGVTTCQAAYLGPLGGAVAMTIVLDRLPNKPVAPSFLTPLFGPVTTACVLAAFPRYQACERDAAIQDASTAVPAPFASLVNEVDAVAKILSYYALNRQPLNGDPAATLAEQLNCH